MENILATSLHNLSESFHSAVDSARIEFEASTDVYQFLKYEDQYLKKEEPTKIENMARLFAVAVYGQAECMKKLGVGTRAEMEKLWGEHLTNPDVSEAVDALLNAERSWLEFVDQVDQKLAIEEDKLTTSSPAHAGKQLPRDLCIFNASSGQQADLDSLCKASKYTLFMYVRNFG